MKHKISKLLLISLLLAHLPACIEVKDQDDVNAFVQTIQGGDLVIEEPLYLIGGEFLRESEMRNYENSQSSELSYEYRFSNLEIGPKGVLYTMGNNVRIYAETFTSMGGNIASFPEGQTSSVGNGRSGGHIGLWAARGEGVLNLSMRGENGKKGDPGASPSAELKGSTGASGPKIRHCVIDLSFLKGEQGGKGQPGNSGENGFNGGDSGTAVVTILSSVSLKTTISVNEGKAGQGGAGGAGGDGGDGGLGGSTTCSKKRALNGLQGAQGPPGQPGNPGTNGSKQTVCLEINKLSQCEGKSFSYSR